MTLMMSKDDVLKLTRREVRYRLYRIRTYEEGGSSHTAKALKEYYENQEGFTGWSSFAREWDLDKEGEHHKIVKRQFTEEQEWNSQLSGLAEDFPWLKK